MIQLQVGSLCID